MPIWCPKCHYKTILKAFNLDRCPQCGELAEPDQVLREDPYEIKSKPIKRRHQENAE